MDGGVGGSMVSLVSPEVKHGISRVVNYIEDMYGLIVRPVRLCICFVYIRNLIMSMHLFILFESHPFSEQVRFQEMERAFDIFMSAVEHDHSYAPPLR